MMLAPLLSSLSPMPAPERSLDAIHRNIATTLLRRGLVLPTSLPLRGDWPAAVCALSPFLRIKHLEGSATLTKNGVQVQVHVGASLPSALPLERFARQARRAAPALLGWSLYLLQELCRFTRPLLTPESARSWAHEVVHGDWEDLLDLEGEVLTQAQLERRIHREGLATLEDAQRWYDNTACVLHTPWEPTISGWPPADLAALRLHRSLQALPNSPKGLGALKDRLQILMNCYVVALPALHLLADHDDGERSELVVTQYAATRRTRRDHLSELYDRLNDLDPDGPVYSAFFPFTQRRALPRVMRALNHVDQLAQRACHALVGA